MVFESLLLIDKGRDNLFNDEFRIYIENCFDNIIEFYREDNKIFLVLELKQEYSDYEFEDIISKFPYDEFENIGVISYPKDDEYYPTFIMEMDNDIRENIQFKIDNLMDLFMKKIVKIYCNKV
ncbi:hypothetical protein SFBM_0293 [Candidatus Arthromitus sp. SFB-mouse-Japan]|uniref:DUF6762 family protein n=1 Tax=unclassified Candidatus Neoarthromitus TaxID=2638829 RepID=UPI00021B7D69|nr:MULTISPECIES: DUF6762 family protein [unclassified Candidatus Arthromitus]EIA22133.1 hypothetical protein SFB3_387G6 [Candidatus Arthromitus sp. SFB-3]EIA29445.1 hypothetical protein SFB6_002G13 [Candidatus Arthromitus sp. SFB-co]EIA30339.1 hypothetical protein SFBSU_006G20 [Candidatus Arthromitus sp. SFB-mouse-SU]EIA31429.1 hypothetical protein SFB4_016G0 [Candidatus Arthromitus sp. SFB-4]AID44232.1 Hypothetical protein SFBmNL_00313 [Candidatus Arthromitus sp. SFB-mouse-NL]